MVASASAGSRAETGSSARIRLGWCLVALGAHADVQERVYRELVEQLGPEQSGLIALDQPLCARDGKALSHPTERTHTRQQTGRETTHAPL